jgi:hypothetical protein
MAVDWAFLRARSVLAKAGGTASARSLEARIAQVLGLKLRREIPWDVICMAAASAWWFAAPAIFVHLVWRLDAPTILGSGTAAVAIYQCFRWLKNKRYEPINL